MKKALIIIGILLIYMSGYGQTKKEPIEERFLLGGGLGLQFGTITFIEVSPKAGYRLTEHFSAGIGGTYKYFRDRRFGGDYSTSIVGGRVFAQHDIYQDIYGYAEFEYLSYEGYNLSGQLAQIGSENILFGAGYKQWFSRNAYAYIMILYNINETIETPYSNPVIRTGFMIRL